jgi:DNA replication ATP-dependent helicase Dna2
LYISNSFVRTQTKSFFQSPSTCNGCRHLVSCTIYHKAHGGNAATSGLGDLFDNLVNHLTVAHHTFLKHWDRLIDLEARVSQVKKKEIFQPHHSNTGSRHSSPSYFVLDVTNGHSIDSSGKSKRYIYTFLRQKLQPETADQPGEHVESVDFSLKCGDSVVNLVHFLYSIFSNITMLAISSSQQH